VNVLVVFCHPTHDSLIGAVLQRVLTGLDRAGHTVRVTDLYAEGFRPELNEWERLHHMDPPDAKVEIASHAADLSWCEALVMVYPTWWSGQPAMLKGWIDRVWVRGVAYEFPEGATTIRPLLRNVRYLVAVTTHGSAKWTNALEGEGGKRTITRSLRVLCHRRARTHWVALYNVDRSSAEQRHAYLDRVDRSMSTLGSRRKS
jgi:NAD(P)H dehydrogenase (quinone)